MLHRLCLCPSQIKRLREEGRLYMQAHGNKKQQVKELEGQVAKLTGRVSALAGGDMQQSLMEKIVLQKEKASLQAALEDKDRQVSE